MRAFALVFVAAAACADNETLDALTAELGPTPDELLFGFVYVGAAAEQPIELKSIGTGPLVVRPVTLTSDAFSVHDVPEQIPAGGRAVLRVVFTPVIAGAVEGSFELVTDGGERAVRLRGIALAPLDCNDNNDCTIDVFDANAGTCANSGREGECDDRSACTEGDRCASGSCVGRAISCDDGIACTHDVCDPSSGCLFLPHHELCADDDPCTLDQCDRGGCSNPTAPDGTLCGTVVSCVSAEVCFFGNCLPFDIPEGAPCDDGERCTLGDSCTSGQCIGTAQQNPPDVLSDTTLVHYPESATFAGDHLFVSTAYGNRPHFKVMRFDGPIAAPVAAIPALDGTSRMVEVAPGLHVRVRTNDAWERIVETIDTSQPEEPRVVASAVAGWWSFPIDDTAALSGSLLYFCSSQALNAGAELTSIDLQDPLNPTALTYHGTFACHEHQEGFSAHETVWVSYHNEAQVSSGGVDVYRLTASGPIELFAHDFGRRAMPQLPAVRGAFTDGHLVVVDAEIVDLLVWNMDVDPPELFQPSLGLPVRPVLLGLSDRIGIFADGLLLVEYDFTVPSTPVRLADTVELAGATNSELLAIDLTRAAVANTGRLYLYERTSTGLSNSITLRGMGAIDEIRSEPNGLLALSTSSVFWIDPAVLSSPFLAVMPTEAPVDFSRQPVLVDSPDGVAGIYTAGLPLALGGELGSLIVLSSGDTVFTPPASSDPLNEYTRARIERCIGAGMVGSRAPDRFVVVDRCTAFPSVIELASIAADPPPGAGDGQFVHLHEPGFASMLGDGFAKLLDFRAPLSPVIMHERTHSGGLQFGGAAFDGVRWAVVSGEHQLTVIDAATGAELSAGVRDVDFSFTGHVLIDWPVLYASAERPGRDALLLVFAIDRPDAELVFELPLLTPVSDLVERDGKIYVARGEGLTVLRSACLAPP